MLDVMAAALAGEAAAGAIVHDFPDPDGEAAWLRYLLSTGEGWVAETDGAVVGFGIAAWRGAIHWLVSLFVRPEAQGRGIGRLLLERLWPPARGGDRATLVDAVSRPATSLYLRAGLTPRWPVLAFEGAAAPDAGKECGVHLQDDWPQAAQRVAGIDASVFGAARPADHAHWTQAGSAFRSVWTGDGEWLGYARWSPSGRLGPVALAKGADWPAALEALAAEMARGQLGRLRVMVPAVNEPALRWCVERGMRYRGMEIVVATRLPRLWNRCLIHRAGLP